MLSKEDADDACGKHIAHQLRSFSQKQQYFLHFRIHELICQCKEQQSPLENYDRPHFFSPTNFAPPSPQFNPQINMVYMNERIQKLVFQIIQSLLICQITHFISEIYSPIFMYLSFSVSYKALHTLGKDLNIVLLCTLN